MIHKRNISHVRLYQNWKLLVLKIPSWKDKKKKKQAADWDKVIADHISHKQLPKLNSKNNNDKTITKWAKVMNRHLLKMIHRCQINT